MACGQLLSPLFTSDHFSSYFNRLHDRFVFYVDRLNASSQCGAEEVSLMDGVKSGMPSYPPSADAAGRPTTQVQAQGFQKAKYVAETYRRKLEAAGRVDNVSG